jgi:hypothetical protein
LGGTGGHGAEFAGNGAGAGLKLTGGASGKDIDANEIGVPVALDGGNASLSGMLAKMADDAGGSSFDATTDSLHEIASSVSSIPAPGDVADAVWDEAAAGHTGGLKTISDNVDQSLSDTEDNIRGSSNRDLTETYNAVDTLEAALTIVDNNVDAIVAKLPAGMLSDMSLGNAIDGVTLSSIFELIMAMANGRYRLNTPIDGQITFYKRDNATELFTVNVTDTERSRVV